MSYSRTQLLQKHLEYVTVCSCFSRSSPSIRVRTSSLALTTWESKHVSIWPKKFYRESHSSHKATLLTTLKACRRPLLSKTPAATTIKPELLPKTILLSTTRPLPTSHTQNTSYHSSNGYQMPNIATSLGSTTYQSPYAEVKTEPVAGHSRIQPFFNQKSNSQTSSKDFYNKIPRYAERLSCYLFRSIW